LRGFLRMAMLQAMTQATRKGTADVRISAQPRRVPQGLAGTPIDGTTTTEGGRDDRIQALRGLPPRGPDAPGLPPRLAHGRVRTPTTTPKASEGGRDVRIPQALRGLPPRGPDAPGLQPPLAHGLAPLTRGAAHVRSQGLPRHSLRLPPQLDTGRNAHVRTPWLSRRLSPLDATCERRGTC
jgi:hypothetical protein